MKYLLLFLFVLSHFELLSQNDFLNKNSMVIINEFGIFDNHRYLSAPPKFIDKTKLILLDQHDFLHILDIGNDKQIKMRPEFLDKDEWVRGMEITHDGLKAVIAFQKETFKKIRKNAAFTGGLDSAFDFETQLVCLSLKNVLLQWKVQLAKMSRCDGVFILPGDSLVFIKSHQGRNILVDLNDGKVLKNKKYSTLVGMGKNMVISKSGRYLAYWNRPAFKTVNIRFGSKLHVWDFVQNKIVYSKFISGRGVWSGVFVGDETGIIVGSYDGSLKLWNFKSDSLHLLQQVRHPISDLILVQADRQLLAINTFNSDSLFFYTYPEMIKVCLFTLCGDNYLVGSTLMMRRYAISDDGRIFALFQRDNKISLYRTDNWLLLKQIELN